MKNDTEILETMLEQYKAQGSYIQTQALTSAISDLQAYEKLKERLDVEKIENIIYDKGNWETLYAQDVNVKSIAKSILNFLKEE